MSFRVVSLRRYPVKSMGGESLAVAHIVTRGISGDRIFAVRDEEGRLASAGDAEHLARRDGVFSFKAQTEGRRVVVWDASGRIGDAGRPEVDAALTDTLGVPLRITHETDTPHIDEGAVSLVGSATLEWCAREFGGKADPTRLRVNLVVETSEPFEEDGWVGANLANDGVRLKVAHRIRPTPAIDLAPLGAEAPPPWWESLQKQRDGYLGVCCDVVARGALAVRDEFTVNAPGIQ